MACIQPAKLVASRPRTDRYANDDHFRLARKLRARIGKGMNRQATSNTASSQQMITFPQGLVARVVRVTVRGLLDCSLEEYKQFIRRSSLQT